MAAGEPIQPPLVALTEDEIAEYQRLLPTLVGELAAMKTKHAGLRAEMAEQRSDLQTRIDNIAQQLRDCGR